MKRYLSVASLLVFALLVSSNVKAGNTPPAFTSDTLYLSVCENSSASSLDVLLDIADPEIGQTETWSALTGPAHGTSVLAYTTTSTGSTLTPVGLSYTPSTGYSGTDTFVVVVSDGIDNDTTTVCVTVNPLPDAGSISGASAVCAGAVTTLTDMAIGGSWSSITGNASAGTTGDVTGVTAGVDTVVYTVTNGCGTDTAEFEITVDPLPDAGIITGPKAVCKGATITLSDAAPGGSWTSTKPAVATVAGGVVTGKAAGKTLITYKVTNSCGSAEAKDSITVDQKAAPIVDTSLSKTLCPGSTLALIETVPGGSWSSSSFFTALVLGTTVAGFDVGGVIGLTPGAVTISYTLNNACGKSVVTENLTVLSLADCNTAALNSGHTASYEAGLKIFPNPTSGAFNLRVGTNTNEDLRITITNMVGETVRTFITETNRNNDITLNVPPGMYYITATTATKRYNAKVVVDR